jgi:hypothetical protein
MIVDPKWTFVEALDAAWANYPGGKQFGAPNRIKMLAQWANVVGRERALAELNATLSNYTTLSAAAKAFGFSEHALRTVRSDFSAMPAVTPHVSSPATLRELFVSLPEIGDESQLGFITRTVPRLATLLGYAESELSFEMNLPGLGRGIRVDAILRPHGAARPKVLIEVKLGRAVPANVAVVIDQIREHISAVGAEVGLLLSPNFVSVVQADGHLSFIPERISETDLSAVTRLLSKAASTTSASAPPPAGAAARLQLLLAAVSDAITNDEKRASLEQLAAEAFSVHASVRPKFRNLRTRSSEIDIVCEVSSDSPFAFLSEQGRYFLVECKNWAKPAGAKEIRDFLGKLRKCHVRVGVYFSRNGITGQEHGTDAIREIHSAFDTDRTYVLVVAEQELAGIDSLEQIMEVLEDKMDALRFDL